MKPLLTAFLTFGVAAFVSSAAKPSAAKPDENRFTRTVLVEALNKPMQLQFDAAGRVYWNERSNGGIRRLDEKTGQVDLLGTLPGFIYLRKPEGSEAVGDGGASEAGGAACRKPAPQAPAGQARQDSSRPGGPVE